LRRIVEVGICNADDATQIVLVKLIGTAEDVVASADPEELNVGVFDYHLEHAFVVLTLDDYRP
jgi:hypothetical protein